MTEWSSWHLHLGSAARTLHDRVLAEVVRPTVAGLDDRPWFFIRYWQGGPHLRLRIGDLNPTEFGDIEQTLGERLAVAGSLAEDEPSVVETVYRAGAARFASPETGADHQVLRLREPGVHRAEYAPEHDRYGGLSLMARTERLFQLSSELVLILLQRAPADDRTRAMLALRGAMAAATALGDRTEQALFYAHGLAAWQDWASEYGYPRELIDRTCAQVAARSRSAVPDPNEHGAFRAWHLALVELATRIRAVIPVHPGAIVSSHVHMLHNRLGHDILGELRTYAWLANVFPAAEAAGAPR
jgi:thiopeptide-type bacteriocin biosynthesis protein